MSDTATNTEKDLPRTITYGIISAEHPTTGISPILVAPTTAEEFNTIEERLIPKGCFLIQDVLFEFDSSFVKPDIASEMQYLADLMDKHKITAAGSPPKEIKPPLSIFGHADPVGNDDYNKQLSGRRAKAIYGMLVRDEKLWEELFSQPFGGDNWGNKPIQTMLAALGHDPGPINGVMGEQAKAAVKEFQTKNGLTADGVAGPNTRKKLFRAYMDLLCGPRLELKKEEDFLALGKDSAGKGDFQGCSEFNPVLVFSKEEDEKYKKATDKTERNHENAPNRRVMILLFAPGRRVNPQFWPCPRAKEGVANCKLRFFPDADKRRSFQEQRREFKNTKNTFACRFYQIISDDSPCEGFLAQTVNVRLFGKDGSLLRDHSCIVEIGGVRFKKMTDQNGVLEIHVPSNEKDGFVDVGDGRFPIRIDFLFDVASPRGAKQRLRNLGYYYGEINDEQDETFRYTLMFFQTRMQTKDSEIKVTGLLDKPTIRLLKREHII